MSSAGGVIFDPGGNKQNEFAWGIGRNTNNYVEWLALLKGLEIAIDLGIKELAVLGNSLLVIIKVRKLVKNYKSPFSKVHHIFNSLINEFNAVNFLHILQENNIYADQMENSGAKLNYGCMISNGNTLEHCCVP